ncbi:hypothetical protein H5410_036769 [Solanum commersonii]|uniref:Uncharacterized protein n=1 Tax=Solanum commersonii TaxID=4109 RepID=A0A9J5Y580_SOLCO|nr:hypothetical protein H5410_036769 [Solanum commersonii]
MGSWSKRNKKGGRKKEPQQVWANVQISIGSQFKALEGVDKEIIIEVEFKEAPDLFEEAENGMQHRVEREEVDAINNNIQQISKAGDLSQRHTNSLKEKRGQPNIPLQVKTRSSKERTTCNDQ